MKRLRCLLLPALLIPLCGCESVTVDLGHPRASRAPRHLPPPPPPPPVEAPPAECPPVVVEAPEPEGPYGHLPQRMSFSPKSNVELKEGCYEGDFALGSVQIRVTGAGVGKTVIHGNLVLQTQCVVSNVTVTGDVIFEGHQAELKDSDFFGRIIDKGMQNRY